MPGIRFDWDEAKNLSNQRKHGVSFEDASEVFRDPLFVSLKDRIEDGEQRWQTFGEVEGCLLLMVAHTVIEANEHDEDAAASYRGATSQPAGSSCSAR